MWGCKWMRIERKVGPEHLYVKGLWNILKHWYYVIFGRHCADCGREVSWYNEVCVWCAAMRFDKMILDQCGEAA
jgi:hypothetical protein